MKLPETPKLTVDAVIRYAGAIVLIERKNPPIGLALPGGFVDVGEMVEIAVLREAQEETNLDCDIKGFVGVYSDPNRDMRGHIVTVAFALEARYDQNPKAMDDAKELHLLEMGDAMAQELVADHNKILEDAVRKVFKRRIYD